MLTLWKNFPGIAKLMKAWIYGSHMYSSWPQASTFFFSKWWIVFDDNNNDNFIKLGKKLPLYPTEEAEVLLLSERVMEANRMAKIELKVRKDGFCVWYRKFLF